MEVDTAAPMTTVFIDSSFWIAFRSLADVNHAAAVRIAAAIAAERASLLSTVLVFSEIHAFFCRMIKVREQIITDFWDRGVIQLEPVTYPDQQTALGTLRKYRDKDLSFCDASSFAVMQRLKIRRVASFDQHFRAVSLFDVIDDPGEAT